MYDFSYCSFERMPPRDESFEKGNERMKTVPYFFSKYRTPWVGRSVSEACVGGIVLCPLF